MQDFTALHRVKRINLNCRLMRRSVIVSGSYFKRARRPAYHVVYPGSQRYRLDEAIEVVPIGALAQIPTW